MSYIPIVIPPVTDPPPSPRSRELAELLNKVVAEYSSAHPAVTRSEIQQAIRMTQMATRGGNRSAVALRMGVVSLLVGVLVLGLVLARDGGGLGTEGAMPMAVLAIIILVLMILLVLKSTSR